MRVLTSLPGAGAVLVTALLAVGLAATQAVAHGGHDHGPDHGLNNSTYHTLWAADADVANQSVLDERTDDESRGYETLGLTTDVPLDRPPKAVERWNRGDLGEFPDSGPEASVYPAHAALENGTYVADAHATVFAVQPTTRARLAPGDQPRYAAPEGQLLGVVDYRVRVPLGDSNGSERSSWELTSHDIDDVELRVDGRSQATKAGERTPTLAYDLGAVPGDQHRLTLEANISVELVQTTWECEDADADDCERQNEETEQYGETVIVRDSVTVTEYDLDISGYRTRYPNGDHGLVVYRSRPWLGVDLPHGMVRGVWRFYSARDRAWDTLVRANRSTERRRHSPLHPLQVHAYPIETGPTVRPSGMVTLLAAFGEETRPPTLPDPVRLDILTEPYTASYGLAVRARPTGPDAGPAERLTAYGLVRGVKSTVSRTRFAPVDLRETNLTVSVLNRSETTVRVRASLRDNLTGAPIATSDRAAHLELNGERVNTSTDGTVTATLDRAGGGVSTRLVTGPWWATNPAYVGADDAAYAPSARLRWLHVLYTAAVPVALFLLGGFILDRLTGLALWPPWRGL
ncbi:hypothetical protein ACKVMT_17350 [Halobacteriales archaeon Cl-PHB]